MVHAQPDRFGDPLNLFPNSDDTIAGFSKKLRSGSSSCVSLLERCLSRIDELESSIHAWVNVDREAAKARARELDELAQAGNWQGPLHGIPIGIKDIVDVAGFPTAVGVDWYAQENAAADAPLVAQLRQAGAIILGKTVTTAFASFDPPVTRNPWNTNHTPGGSSSGSAAAVAAGMCLAAIGSQTGGSITRPASFCGVAGFKPTFDRISVDGVFPLAPSLDHPGPIARTVDDLAILAEVLMSPSPRLADEADTGDVPTPRIGRLTGLFQDRAEPAMKTACDTAIQTLQSAGADVTDVSLPECFDKLLTHHRCIMAAEAAAVHEVEFEASPDRFPPCIRELVEEGLAYSAATYIAARNHQERSRTEVVASFGDADVLITPAATGPAPDLSTTGDPSFNSPWSHTGFPTVSFPIGLAPDGLPLGIQLIGRPDDEQRLFQAARWCEAEIRESHAG